MKKKKLKYYSCPNPHCNYLITMIEVNQAKYDYPCPKCDRSTLMKFYIIHK